MRITDLGMSNDVLYNLNTNLDKMNQYQLELSSGKTFQLPSDAPGTYDNAAFLTTAINANDQFKANTSETTSWVQATATQMQNVQGILARTHDLAVQAANGTYNGADRQDMAAEVYNLRESLREVLNTQVNGRYLFGGTQTQTQPYPPSGVTPPAVIATPYNVGVDDPGQMQVEVDAGNTITYNVRGFDAIGNTAANAGVNANTLAAMDNFYNDLVNNNQGNIGNVDIAALNNSITRLSSAASANGAVQNRLDLTHQRLTDLNTNLKALLSVAQDVDMPSVITNLNTQENVYKASLAAGARAIQPSLMDYLH